MIVPFLFAIALLAAGPAHAQEAAVSGWSRSSHSWLRLIAGPTTPSGKQRVGVEIMMEPGYKTYWRTPGDSGVPPVFDWSGSINVGGLDVRWPTPERFEDGAGFSIGYIGEVVVPISVQPVDPARPVMLILRLSYAVCDKICVPATGEAQLWLEPGVTSVTSPRLDSYEVRVPQRVKVGQQREGINVLEVRPGQNTPSLRMTMQPAANGTIEDVFVEGPGSWAFERPRFVTAPDGKVTAVLRVLERPKSASGPVPFVVTVRGNTGAVETRFELEIPGVRP